MAAYTRKQYSGAARNTTTTTLLGVAGTSVTIAANTGWPSSPGVPFYVVISPSSLIEEKCLATISGLTLTLTRAQDDTTASEHPIGSVIYPVFTANDADEANELVSKLTTKGDLLVTDGNGLYRLGVGPNGYFLKANSSASVGVEWASIPTINNLNDVGDVTISNIEGGDFLVYDNTASAWVNETLHFITVSDTAPNDEVAEGDLWYNSLELELYTYYSGIWIQLTATPEPPTVEELDNVYADNLTVGDVLAYDGYDWYNDTVSNLFGSHIIALSGDVSGSVMFDGSASVNISTAIDTAVIQARVANVTDTEIGYLDGVTSAIQTQLDSKQPTFTGYDYEIHVSQVDGNDTTGNGDILKPVASITKALTLVTSQRKTVIIHPGTYTESPSITTQYTTMTGPGLIGGNIVISGTVSTNTGCTISGIKMTNLTVSTPTAQGNVNILNCEVSGTFTKSSNADYTVARLCDFGAASITGAGLVAIFGGNPNFITVNNASANVIVKSAVTVSPVLTAGTLSLVDSVVGAAVTNAVTSAASSVITLANCQFLTSNLGGVAPVVLNGFYSILNCVYDKPSSTLAATSGTGGTTNAVDYFQYINADKFITQGGTSAQVVKGDGSLGSVALGTETTGNYMSDLTQGTGITITHTPGEGSNATIAIGQAVGTSASVTFANVTVTGDLTVSGTTTSINTETLTVDDNIIVLNNNATGAPSQNAGIEVERGSSTNVALRWNESSDKWETTNDGSTYSVVATNGNIALGTDTTGNSDNVTEGTTNLYFTDGRARTALLADNAGTASGIRFIAPNTGTVELISHEATRFVRVTSNAAVGGGKTEIQGSAQILASSSISDPGHLTVAGSVTVGGGVIFEGDTANDYETSLVATDPTADRTITLPNATTTLVGTDTTQTLSNKTLTTPTINGPEITATGGTPRIHGIYLPEPHFITFEGSTTDEFETVLTVVDPTADRTVSIPNESGTLAIGQNVSTSASVTFVNITATGNVAISGRIDKTTVRESVADVSVSASVVTADYSTGDIFYVGTAPASNFTVNLTNAPTDDGKAITVVLFVTQGATGYYPNVVQVAGSAQTIKWANGAAPTPTSSTGKIDIFSFTFVRRSSAWTVFGSSNLGY